MNINSQLLKKLSRLTLVGLSAGILLAVSLQPLNVSNTFEKGPQLVSADEDSGDSNPLACNQTGTYYAKLGENGTCQPFTNVCIQPGWINCNTSIPSSAQPSCDQLAGNYGICGERTYDQCSLRYDGNQAYYDCHASQNSNCQGTIRCPGQDRSQPVNNIPPQAPANSQCILGPAGVANYPGPTGSSQWCSCAAQNSDMGSLMRENCPQAPRDVANPTQPARSCDDLAADYGVCGQRTYDRCNLRYMGTQAYYDCQASQNAQCQGTIRCASQDRQTTVTNPTQGGGATAVANCPTGTTPTTGSSQNTVVCVANANSNNNSNNNTNTSNSTSQSNATGGSAVAYGGAGGSSIVTINGVAYPANNGQRIVYATNGNVGVGTSNGQRVVYVQSASGVKELPKTGLPLLAWSALAFLPAGIKMRRFSSIKEDFASNATYLWEQRSFKRS